MAADQTGAQAHEDQPDLHVVPVVAVALRGPEASGPGLILQTLPLAFAQMPGGALESGWGTSKLARESNNFFGITAYGSPNAYWKGAKRISTSSGLPFRVYDSVENGFRDFAHLITKKYKEAAKASDSVTEYARLIANSPYINEKNGDNRSLYKQIIIKNAAAILTFAKKLPRP